MQSSLFFYLKCELFGVIRSIRPLWNKYKWLNKITCVNFLKILKLCKIVLRQYIKYSNQNLFVIVYLSFLSFSLQSPTKVFPTTGMSY